MVHLKGATDDAQIVLKVLGSTPILWAQVATVVAERSLASRIESAYSIGYS